MPIKCYQVGLNLTVVKTGDEVTPSLSIEKQKNDRVLLPVIAPTSTLATTSTT